MVATGFRAEHLEQTVRGLAQDEHADEHARDHLDVVPGEAGERASAVVGRVGVSWPHLGSERSESNDAGSQRERLCQCSDLDLEVWLNGPGVGYP